MQQLSLFMSRCWERREERKGKAWQGSGVGSGGVAALFRFKSRSARGGAASRGDERWIWHAVDAWDYQL